MTAALDRVAVPHISLQVAERTLEVNLLEYNFSLQGVGRDRNERKWKASHGPLQRESWVGFLGGSLAGWKMVGG